MRQIIDVVKQFIDFLQEIIDFLKELIDFLKEFVDSLEEFIDVFKEFIDCCVEPHSRLQSFPEFNRRWRRGVRTFRSAPGADKLSRKSRLRFDCRIFASRVDLVWSKHRVQFKSHTYRCFFRFGRVDS